MRLSRLVAGFSITPPGADPDITGVTENSRRIEPGMLFVAVPGTALDGHAYIGDAVARGAAAIGGCADISCASCATTVKPAAPCYDAPFLAPRSDVDVAERRRLAAGDAVRSTSILVSQTYNPDRAC